MPLMATLRRQRALLLKVLAVAMGVYLVLSLALVTQQKPGVQMASEPLSHGYSYVQKLLAPDPCAAWDPAAPEAEDPPNCLRAQQFREFQAFHVSGQEAKLDTAQRKAIREAERCVLGVTKCPERPIIVIDYRYFFKSNADIKGSGEVVWGWGIIDSMRANGFILLTYDGEREKDFMKSWAITRALSKSIHMYWTDSNAAVRCFLDSRCIRPEDYVPHWNESYRLPEVEGETGVLPAWRVFGVNFWGSRPQKYHGQSQDVCRDWGQCDDQDWSYHILGNQWVITPFEYPNHHTHIPMTIEQACLSTPAVPQSERKNGVLVLAKLPDYFHLRHFTPTTHAFDYIAKAMKGIELWTTAHKHKEEGKHPIPSDLVQLGPQEPAKYVELLSSARALLGVGKPEISPTPYEALCRGVPVVLPWVDHPEPVGWEAYHDLSFQHGPIMALGEPYAYSYNISDPDDLVEKLTRAVNTPIERFVPEDMTVAAVHERVREVLFHDWEGEYNRIKMSNGGQMPQYSEVMIEKCFDGGHVAPCSGEYPLP